MKNTGVLLINAGTPKSYRIIDVARYLSQFLGDKNIIQIPWLLRKILVNFFIIPFRSFKSAKKYKCIWTKNGSPLLENSLKFENKLSKGLGEDFKVFLGMRYGNPGLKEGLKKISNFKPEKIIILPLYPQYAVSTTFSSIEKVKKLIRKFEVKSELKIIQQFYANELFINAFVNRINRYHVNEFEHILFSFHGLPLKQVYQNHQNESCSHFKCLDEINDKNMLCYQAACYHTARLIVKKLNLTNSQYSICFQSRFSKNWLSPFTDEIIVQKANEGVKNILVVCPSFVADCLETLYEIGIEYNELFIKHGGQKLQLVESLNDGDDWVNAVKEIIAR